jgi:acetate kinase
VLVGNIEGLEPGGTPEMSWTYQSKTQSRVLHLGPGRVFAQALLSLHELLSSLPGVPEIVAVAHRVVHGAALFRASVIVTDEIFQQLTQFNS